MKLHFLLFSSTFSFDYFPIFSCPKTKLLPHRPFCVFLFDDRHKSTLYISHFVLSSHVKINNNDNNNNKIIDNFNNRMCKYYLD